MDDHLNTTTMTQDRTLSHIGITRERVEQLTARYKPTTMAEVLPDKDKCVFPESTKARIHSLKAEGYNYRDIAAEVGCSKTSVYNVLKEGK